MLTCSWLLVKATNTCFATFGPSFCILTQCLAIPTFKKAKYLVFVHERKLTTIKAYMFTLLLCHELCLLPNAAASMLAL